MTRPTLYLLRMLVFLVAVAVVAGLLGPVLARIFANNLGLNALIVFILAVGIGWNLRQVLRLSPEVTWVETYQTGRPRLAALPSPRLLAPMASMLAVREGTGRPGHAARFTLSTTATRSLLDSIASRLDESRELSRYMTGLLIFLGLLGTFWGLLKTVSSVSDVIQGMSSAPAISIRRSSSSNPASPDHSQAWGPRFRRACLVFRVRWCWASSI